MYYHLLPEKKVEFNFSGPKQSFGRPNSADRKQLGTKWSEGAKWVPIAAFKETPPPYLIYPPRFFNIR